METVFIFSEVFPSSGEHHLNYWRLIFKERLYLTNVTDFLAKGNHFLPFFQEAVKMEKNGSRKLKTKLFPLARKSVFVKNWPPLISMTLST